MKHKILIVEDQFIEANNLRLILDRAGYTVLPIASSFVEAMEMLETGICVCSIGLKLPRRLLMATYALGSVEFFRRRKGAVSGAFCVTEVRENCLATDLDGPAGRGLS